jgi:hypothetical protein
MLARIAQAWADGRWTSSSATRSGATASTRRGARDARRLLDERNPRLAERIAACTRRQVGVRRGRQPAHDRPAGCPRCSRSAGTRSSACASAPSRARRAARRQAASRGSAAMAHASQRMHNADALADENTMADAPAFTKLVPGFDFLQGLVKNAGSALPNIGQWVAPTLNPEELEKRIEELRTVQFWLEQNARMLGATIQALEVSA